MYIVVGASAAEDDATDDDVPFDVVLKTRQLTTGGSYVVYVRGKVEGEVTWVYRYTVC